MESNPYKGYLKEHQNDKVQAFLSEHDKNGVYGLVDNKYNLFIPMSELGWEQPMQNYKLNTKNLVEIIGLNAKNECLIGSLKYKTEHPLKKFSERYPVGYVFPNLKLDKVYQWGTIMNVSLDSKRYEILLFRGDIIDGCFINSCEEIFKNISYIPVMIKEIDFDKRRIIGSLKKVIENNSSEGISYDDSFDAIIVGSVNNNYVVIIIGKWIKGILETTTKYPIGKQLKVRPSLLRDVIIFTED